MCVWKVFDLVYAVYIINIFKGAVFGRNLYLNKFAIGARLYSAFYIPIHIFNFIKFIDVNIVSTVVLLKSQNII